MNRRGQISIDRIVALRSSVLPLYVLVDADGTLTAADEIAEDGTDFFTTRIHGDQISFQSLRGYYLSAEGGEMCTRRYCSADERFWVERLDTQYAFRTRSGQYLSINERAPFVGLASSAEDTEMFQLFSLMMAGVNVGKQLEILERDGAVRIDGLLGPDQLAGLRDSVARAGGNDTAGKHEARCVDLAARDVSFTKLAVHPMVMQLAVRGLSPRLRLSDMESCCTNADNVRKELEVTTWHVAHPYSVVEHPGVVDPRISCTATWFLDSFDEENSTWAYAKAPMLDGAHVPALPQLSSPEDVQAVVANAKPLHAPAGALWLYLGPVWMSNNVSAASFWKDYDAQTRYKHLSGQKEQTSFRALTDTARSQPTREELCPTVLQATYVREYVAPRSQSALPASDNAPIGMAEGEWADVVRLAGRGAPPCN
mmetsp:Transcript_54537/g.165780  ORF Transcript_54537/g.165780 Transcript_54537/m.165780 type:complete len:426 (-) Transcript_54537:121-1398(-)